MTGRILIVDDVATNIKLLEARLSAEYYTLKTATNGQQAIDMCENENFDLILLDVMMPVMDGFEACKRIKANPKTEHIPIILLTALDQPTDKVQGLEAGADDFLTKPVNEVALLTRVRSLLRLKSLMDELRIRAETSKNMGVPSQNIFDISVQIVGKILIVDEPVTANRIAQRLSSKHTAHVEINPLNTIENISSNQYDIVLIGLDMPSYDGLRLCAQIRADERLRQFPILVLVNAGDNIKLLRAIDLGVNDYLLRPIDANEMFARIKTQVRRKHYSDSLRTAVDNSITMAIFDTLTGVHNRRYFESHVETLVNEAQRDKKPLSLVVFDIDHFKRINDNYGHDIGDLVLKEFANRIKHKMRAVDLFARLGGEEFSMLMPDTDVSIAIHVAERLRLEISDKPFIFLDSSKNININLNVNVSIGVSNLMQNDTSLDIIKRADQALYEAKSGGRNCVKSA